ncbi:hypothetical protein C2845_PM04G19730 [Panicum miliaceum]|uniref:RRP4 S1 domain-containing protein n=1 Tax=Panicum miliaceum TaxID=4540 RepID=A0A3L6QRR5_PANMI|nr:hypothetical protein C2845_PM04G19730 [Panicum miliaceum]
MGQGRAPAPSQPAQCPAGWSRNQPDSNKTPNPSPCPCWTTTPAFLAVATRGAAEGFCKFSQLLFFVGPLSSQLTGHERPPPPTEPTQRVRCEKALHELQVLTPTTVLAAAVTIADTIPVNHEDSILRGHWTSDQKGKLVSTLCGVVEWADKLQARIVDKLSRLIPVCSLYFWYRPEICDILVGRVIKVGPESWRLEINSKQDAVMRFSSTIFPDGIQRRRTAVDELKMRSIFEENDVVYAEVCAFQHDGSPELQPMGQKNGNDNDNSHECVLEHGDILGSMQDLVPCMQLVAD